MLSPIAGSLSDTGIPNFSVIHSESTSLYGSTSRTFSQSSEVSSVAEKRNCNVLVLMAPITLSAGNTLGRMHSDAQFAGSSSVPAHVEMMGLIGMGNNPMVGATVAVAVAIEKAMK